GQLLPQVRRAAYPPFEGTVREFTVKPGDRVGENGNLAKLYDVTLATKLHTLETELNNAREEAEAAERLEKRPDLQPNERERYHTEGLATRSLQVSKERDIGALKERTRFRPKGDGDMDSDLQALRFPPEEGMLLGSRREWTVLNGNFREEWTG